MEYKNIFSFDIEWNYKTISTFFVLLALPNLLGMMNISTPWGFKLHFFQLAVFIAALIYGPLGGMFSGMVGSLYPAVIMHNPYIVGGNMILGLFVGLFVRYKINIILAVLLAYIVQLPWLIITDYFFMHLSGRFIVGLVIALAISNTIWAIVSGYFYPRLKRMLS